MNRFLTKIEPVPVGSKRGRIALRLFMPFQVSKKVGADSQDRTGDLRITNAPLYQLSYSGEVSSIFVIPGLSGNPFPR